MSTLDVFQGDAFTTTSLTESINLLPYQPRRIGQMGLFAERGVPNKTVWIEENRGAVAILATKTRGVPGEVNKAAKRTGRSFDIPHIPLDDAVLADAIQGVRAFGSETELQTMSNVVSDKLEEMLAHHVTTLEYHRIGAIRGDILDSDGSTSILNLFTAFGITETVRDFDFSTGTTDVRESLLSVHRSVESAMGAGTYDHIHGFAGESWFEQYIAHADVKDAYARFQDGAWLRSDPRSGFPFVNVVIEEYRGNVDSIPFVPTGQCRFFPVGAQGLFQTYFGPGTWMETVNVPGQPVFAKQVPMEADLGIKVLTQSNPLSICTKPGVLVKGTDT
jgi:hypothetical protein